jgi:hypothetical protein
MLFVYITLTGSVPHFGHVVTIRHVKSESLKKHIYQNESVFQKPLGYTIMLYFANPIALGI